MKSENKMINESSKTGDDAVSPRLDAYLRFMSLPAEAIQRGWREADPSLEMRGLSNAEVCHFNVRKHVGRWSEQLAGVHDHGAAGGTFPGRDAVIAMFDRSTDKPVYKSVADTGATAELSSIRRQVLMESRRNAAEKPLLGNDGVVRPDAGERDARSAAGTGAERPLSFEAQWEDVVHLRSTREFCAFLTVNAHLEKPEFLVRAGLFDDHSARNGLRKRNVSTVVARRNDT